MKYVLYGVTSFYEIIVVTIRKVLFYNKKRFFDAKIKIKIEKYYFYAVF